ncbi:MAG: hypothetical protein WDM85_14380 [Caulobacteraceae bacterium]
MEHGTVTAIVQGRPFEITTLRRDVETDGRRAVVAFTTDWAEDAQRRDFRLNALYADPAAGCTTRPKGAWRISPSVASSSSAMPRPASARTHCASCASSASTPGMAVVSPTRPGWRPAPSCAS